jgi:hypothetical protein
MSRTGIITTYLNLRLLVGSGFLDIYPGQTVPAHLQSLFPITTNRELAQYAVPVPGATAASRTQPWLASKWGGPGRHFSTLRKGPHKRRGF